MSDLERAVSARIDAITAEEAMPDPWPDPEWDRELHDD